MDLRIAAPGGFGNRLPAGRSARSPIHMKRLPALTLLVLGSALCLMAASSPSPEANYTIRSARDFGRVEKLMNASEAERVVVTIAPGRYLVRDTFNIGRSGVELRGEGEVELRLAARAQRPVIAVGSQKEYVDERDLITGIVISDLAIDGNKERQRSEYDRKLPWIRNNGIDARAVSGLLVERIRSDNNRSGGLVISWGCSDVLVRDCVFEGNYFDGVAYYDSERVYTVDCVMRQNDGAGISLDNGFVDSVFARCRLEGNRDVGVFARDSARLVFEGCEIVGSGNWGVFMSHDEKQRGVFEILISQTRFEGNNGGVRLGSVTQKQSAGNRIAKCLFVGNDRHGRSDASTAGSPLVVMEEDWQPTDEDGGGSRPGRLAAGDEDSERLLERAVGAIERLSRG